LGFLLDGVGFSKTIAMVTAGIGFGRHYAA